MELSLPVEHIDALCFFCVQQVHLFVIVEIRSDERIAAFDVAAQIGERPFVKEFALMVE